MLFSQRHKKFVKLIELQELKLKSATSRNTRDLAASMNDNDDVYTNVLNNVDDDE